MTIRIPYESADEIVIASLYESYENLYYNYVSDLTKYNNDQDRYAFKRSDLIDMQASLNAFTRILKYYTPRGDKVVPPKLEAIRDRIDYKDKITNGLSRMSRMTK